MSMEDWVLQFMTDAQKPRSANTPKEIAKLRKFLFKNQEHRFTEREQSHLFQAIQLHVTAYTPAAGAASGDEEDNPAVGLLEDALKMPFTVFTTSHKKSYLKWLDKLTGNSQSAADGAGGGGGGNGTRYQVIDVTETIIQVMDDDGTTLDVSLQGVGALADEIRARFEAGDDVHVCVQIQGGAVSITALL